MNKDTYSLLKEYGVEITDKEGNLKSMEQLLKELENKRLLKSTGGYDLWLD